MTLSSKTRVVVKTNHAACDLEGEGVILNVDDGVYYGLNEVGMAIWRLVQEPAYVFEIRDEIVRQFEIEPKKCEEDVLALLKQLEEASLVQILPSPQET